MGLYIVKLSSMQGSNLRCERSLIRNRSGLMDAPTLYPVGRSFLESNEHRARAEIGRGNGGIFTIPSAVDGHSSTDIYGDVRHSGSCIAVVNQIARLGFSS